MAARVSVYQIPGHHRSGLIASAMLRGISRLGDSAQLRLSSNFSSPDAEVAVFYGFDESMRRVFAGYRAAGLPAVCIDLGYWSRHLTHRYDGYHKISVNNRHPTAYFMTRSHRPDRFTSLGVGIQPWRNGGKHILLCGMSPKAAEACGLGPYSWEQQAIDEIRRHTDRPIVFRPKPGPARAPNLNGAENSAPSQALWDALKDCWAVVSHHSNTGVDGLIAGVPVFCLEGAALPLGSSDLSSIESPRRPDGREQWAANLAWTQWSVREMASGEAWRYLRDERLV